MGADDHVRGRDAVDEADRRRCQLQYGVDLFVEGGQVVLGRFRQGQAELGEELCDRGTRPGELGSARIAFGAGREP
jgi:hypothetical protein